MNASVGAPHPGEWYTRWDRGELFQVTGRDRACGAIVVRAFDGRCAVLDSRTWSELPLSRSAPPAGWPRAGRADGQPAAVPATDSRIVWSESLLG